MTVQTCGTCRHFRPVNPHPSPKGTSGECRRFPPRMVGPDERLSPGYARRPVAEFPVLDQAEWCGEFLARSEAPWTASSKPAPNSPLAHQMAIQALLRAARQLGPAEYKLPPQQWAGIILAAERAAEYLGDIERRVQERRAREGAHA